MRRVSAHESRVYARIGILRLAKKDLVRLIFAILPIIEIAAGNGAPRKYVLIDAGLTITGPREWGTKLIDHFRAISRYSTRARRHH